MMRLGAWTGLAAVGMAALMASSALAQPGGGGGRGGRGGAGFGGGMGGRQTAVTLVGNEAVQKELALTDDQIAKVKTLGEEARAELRPSGDGFAGLRDLPESERRAKMTELMAKQAETSKAVAEKYKPKLAAVLDAKQVERLDEITIQAAGAQAYADPAVVKSLKLTQDQQDKIASINKEAAEKSRELMGAGGGGGGGGGNGEKIRELNQTRDKDLAAVLTADQTAAFGKLKGKEFDVAQLRRGPGGPGGQGGPGGGRGQGGGRQRPAN